MARKRRERDEQRLGQTAIARDALALQEEIAALANRIDALETTELELMERRDVAEAALAEQQALVDETTSEGRRLSEEAKEAVAAATRELEELRRDRDALVGRLPADLLAAYERLAARGYGLTLGVHSRIERFAREIQTLVPAGNIYINRSITGAVV